MDVEVERIQKHGDETSEFIILKVLEDCEIGEYVVIDNTYTSNGSVSNKLRHTFWFPNKEVKKGELVSLRTGIGKNEETTTKDGKKLHRFYWNLHTPVWNDNEADGAVVLHIDDWEATSVP